MITIYSDASIHKRKIAEYPDLPTLAKSFNGKLQDFIYVENGKEISWTEVLKEMQWPVSRKTNQKNTLLNGEAKTEGEAKSPMA